MAKHLQNEIEKLKNSVLELSSLVEESVLKSVKSINDKDEDLARDVIVKDQSIDSKEVDVEEDCLKILALHQPVAIDLRFVVVALKINNDLERIGDLAVNIAERSIFLSKQNDITMPIDFEVMSKKTIQMLKQAIDSLIKMDVDLANKVCLMDDDVDAINRKMYSFVYDKIKETPEFAETLIHFLSVSKNLERIADYATNISMDVVYMIEGTIVRHHNLGKKD